MTKHAIQKKPRSSQTAKELTIVFCLNDETIAVLVLFFVFFKFSQRYFFLQREKETLI